MEVVARQGAPAEVRRSSQLRRREPPPARSYLDSTRLTLELAASLRMGSPVDTSAEAEQAPL
jgi:hypothetical protein